MQRHLLQSLLLVAAMTWAAPTRASNNSSNLPAVGERAITFLKSLPREWSRSSARDCKTYEGKNIDRLATSFATAAASFLDSFRQLHGPVVITSAHRTREEQVCVCIGEKGPCAGRHAS